MKTKDDGRLRSHIRDICGAADKAATLTRSLLAFSRKQILNPKAMDLCEIARNAQKLIVRLVGEDIECRSIFSGEVTTVMADSGQIEQVVLNLVTNARDSMPDGGVLTLRTCSKEIDRGFVNARGYGNVGKYAVLSVSDSGQGMDAKTKERIFEPFFTTKEMGKGTGLGLSIVYGIVKQHNGFIDCTSVPGEGTIFEIYLPLVAPDVADIRTRPTLPAHGTETVLLAEDDGAVRKITKQVLEEFGYNVIEAVDGEDAACKVRKYGEQIQLLITDVIMPRKNGKESYDEIKSIMPGIKVLFTSGYPNDHIHKKGILDEDLNFLFKPAPPAVLLSKVRHVLDAKT
jgi:two-component system cell cycle sensor histidine kinase/response regulator CckA